MNNMLSRLAGHGENLTMVVKTLRTNKLRSGLTLLGIVVGIFSIMSVMTAMSVLRNAFDKKVVQLGANTFQIQRNGPVLDLSRKGFRNRKPITYAQALQVRQKAALAVAVGIESWESNRIARWEGRRTNPNVSLGGEDLEGMTTNDWVVEQGRGLMEQDMQFATKVILLGKAVAEKLFPASFNPLGQRVHVDGGSYEVIGVLQSKGGSQGRDLDNIVILPLPTFLQRYGRAERSFQIMVKAGSREVLDDAMEESVGILRGARGVRPGQEDDFAFFSNDSMRRQSNNLAVYLGLGVLVVSSVALLAAGIGIMNIMLVSVTERTREIGVRKAVGAKKGDILQQFVLEAVVLCLLGGVAGVAAGVIGGNALSVLMDSPAVIPWDWTAIGLGMCFFVGLVFGIYPAWKASTLDPIEALRYE